MLEDKALECCTQIHELKGKSKPAFVLKSATKTTGGQNDNEMSR